MTWLRKWWWRILLILFVGLGAWFAADMMWRRAHYASAEVRCRDGGGTVIYTIAEFVCAYGRIEKGGK